MSQQEMLKVEGGNIVCAVVKVVKAVVEFVSEIFDCGC